MSKLFRTVLLLAIVATPVWAAEVASLYTAQVPLDERQDDPRAHAYETALAEVLLRVSGSELATNPLLVEQLFPNPASYVVQFRPGADDTLWVSFDGNAIERTLRQSGQTVWGSDRPLILIWLAVDWGQGEREIIAADDPGRSGDQARTINRNRLLRERMLDIAQRRGLPVVFPLVDTSDLQNVSFSDIWGGFDEAVLAASERYDADTVLIGRLRPDSAQRNRWTFFFGDQQRSWIGEPEQVISDVGDLLAAEFAISGDARVEPVTLVVYGIETVSDYGNVHRLLSGINVVDEFSILEVEGDRIRFRVDALGGEARLRRALLFGGLIEQNDFAGGGLAVDPYSRTLEFVYDP